MWKKRRETWWLKDVCDEEARKTSTDTIDNEKRAFLASLLETIMAKMIWDEDTDFDDLDEDDRDAFEGLRKVSFSGMLDFGALRTLNLQYRRIFGRSWSRST